LFAFNSDRMVASTCWSLSDLGADVWLVEGRCISLGLGLVPSSEREDSDEVDVGLLGRGASASVNAEALGDGLGDLKVGFVYLVYI